MRSQNELLWAMDQWLTCPHLDQLEKSLVQNLRGTAQAQGLVGFYQLAEVYWTLFPIPMQSAVNKARAMGIGKSWKLDA